VGRTRRVTDRRIIRGVTSGCGNYVVNPALKSLCALFPVQLRLAGILMQPALGCRA
jgi:hypothetical protein